MADPEHDDQSAAPPIQAYYKLTFPNFEYYLQTLSVTIGRRPIDRNAKSTRSHHSQLPHDNEAHPIVVKPEDNQEAGLGLSDSGLVKGEEVAIESLQSLARGGLPQSPVKGNAAPPPSPQPSSSSSRPSRRSLASSAFPHIDVDLGPLKPISRLHARIDYDDTIDKFVLYVNGRNGAWVDGNWVGCGGRVALGAKTQIQIATRTFYFELPPSSHPLHDTPDTTPEADIDPTSADDPLQPASPGACAGPSSSPPPVEVPVPPPISRKRRRSSHGSDSRSPSPTPRRRNSAGTKAVLAKGKGKGKGLGKGKGKGKGKTTLPADPPPAKVEVEPRPKPAPVPVQNESSDDEQLVSINDLHQVDLDELEAMAPSDQEEEGMGPIQFPEKPTTKTKPTNKAGKPREIKKLPAKGLLAPPLPPPSEPSSSKPIPILPLPPKEREREPPQDPNQPRQPKKYMTQRLIAKAQMQTLPRPPPDQMPPKPPFTYAILCYRAITDLGGKASLSEIVNWIREKHEWYRWNDECGWESSVRHNLSSNPGFMKSRRDQEVEMIVQATGQQKKTKGFFWSIDPKHEESFAEKDREISEAGSRTKLQQKSKPREGETTVMATGPDGSMVAVAVKPPPTHMAPSAKPAMPVPMMAPRGMGLGPPPPPPPPVGMSMNPGMHLAPPPMMVAPPVMMSAPPPPMPMMPMPPMFHVPPPAFPPPPNLTPISQPPSATPTPQPSTTPAPEHSPFPHALSDVCLSITIGPVPPEAVASTSASDSPYVDGPPITLHNGSLILNPTIFAGLSREQLEELQKLKAAKALEILTGYTKNFVKEQIVKKGKVKGKAKVNGGGSGKATTPKVEDTKLMPEQSASSSSNAASILAVANMASASAGPSLPPPPAPHTVPPPYPYYGAYPFAYAGGWAHHPPSHPATPYAPPPHYVPHPHVQPWIHPPHPSPGPVPAAPPQVTNGPPQAKAEEGTGAAAASSSVPQVV